MDENEIYDLTNIGTLAAFAIVCVGVLVLRYKDPDRPRPFRVRFVWPVAVLGALACVYIMKGLPTHAWDASASGWRSGSCCTSSTATATAVSDAGVTRAVPVLIHSTYSRAGRSLRLSSRWRRLQAEVGRQPPA